jgi:hypothetical protein
MRGIEHSFMSRRYGAGVQAAKLLELGVQAFVPEVAGQRQLVR